jgi:hypothetical protein
VADLGERGQRLYDAYASRVDDAGLVLLEEAARIADRLDKLDALLRGEADVWCRLVHDLRTEDYELRIDSALVEARQQAAVLRQLLVSLTPSKGPDDGDGDGWLDEVYSALRDPEG